MDVEQIKLTIKKLMEARDGGGGYFPQATIEKLLQKLPVNNIEELEAIELELTENKETFTALVSMKHILLTFLLSCF